MAHRAVIRHRRKTVAYFFIVMQVLSTIWI